MNANMISPQEPRSSARRFACLLVLLAGLTCAACAPSQTASDTATPSATPTPTATVAPPLPEIQAPSEMVEQPLQGSPVDVPDVWIVPARQSKAELATQLRTNAAQLDWVNPGLPEQVPPGTLVVVPPGYYAPTATTLTDVAATTGLPLTVLLSANPVFDDDEIVPAGTVLVVPALHFVTETTDLNQAADRLGVSSETLLSANPTLANVDALPVGTVLVVPPEASQE